MRDKGMPINNKEYRSLMFVEITSRLELELKNAFTESFKLLLLMFISSLGYTRNKKLLGKPILNLSRVFTVQNGGRQNSFRMFVFVIS